MCLAQFVIVGVAVSVAVSNAWASTPFIFQVWIGGAMTEQFLASTSGRAKGAVLRFRAMGGSSE
ncbi:hypothetical protein D1122_14415 [Cereibacter sphaeroides]|nr:hypothetical protein D1122_14415 [Cereibacter sphaeroides]